MYKYLKEASTFVPPRVSSERVGDAAALLLREELPASCSDQHELCDVGPPDAEHPAPLQLPGAPQPPAGGPHLSARVRVPIWASGAPWLQRNMPENLSCSLQNPSDDSVGDQKSETDLMLNIYTRYSLILLTVAVLGSDCEMGHQRFTGSNKSKR